MDEHLSRSYGYQLNAFSTSIRAEWRWPSPNAGFAYYLTKLSHIDLPQGCTVTAPQADWISRLDEAPLLAAAGYVIACGDNMDEEMFEAWRNGIERLRFRNPFTGDRESFVYRPCELLGISLGVTNCPRISPEVTDWLHQTLKRAEAEVVRSGVFSALLGAWAAEAARVTWQPIHLPSFIDMDASDLALAYWTATFHDKLLTGSHPALNMLQVEIVRRFALTQITENDVARAFLLYSSLYICVENMINAPAIKLKDKVPANEKRIILPEPLQTALQNQTVTVIVGAGVSRAVANLKGWADVLRAGIAFLQEHGQASRALMTIEPLMEDGLYEEAAQVVERLLTNINGKADFLRREFHVEASAVNDRSLLEAIWNVSSNTLFTTNYDRLLEIGGAAGVETVTWREPAKMLAALRHGPAVVHLHGVYNDVDSVILSAGNYVRLAEDHAYENFSQTLWMKGPLFFIGVSPSGIGDADFSRLFAWGQRIVPHLPYVSYILQVVGAISAEEKRRLYTDYKVEVIEYGNSFSELTPFLNSIANKA